MRGPEEIRAEAEITHDAEKICTLSFGDKRYREHLITKCLIAMKLNFFKIVTF